MAKSTRHNAHATTVQAEDEDVQGYGNHGIAAGVDAAGCADRAFAPATGLPAVTPTLTPHLVAAPGNRM